MMNNKFNPNPPSFKSVKACQPLKFKTKKSSLQQDYVQTSKNEHYKDKPSLSIYTTEANKSSKEGFVKVSVKDRNKPIKSKSGALSPRAPEKIRNNRASEMKVYGEHACSAIFQQRPEAIVRLWITSECAKKTGALLSYLADHKKAYHLVDTEEMLRVTGTEHHGGMCLLVKKSTPFSLEGYLQLERQHDCLILLDGVNNAQNIGGIIRTCAFYGIKGIIVENNDILNSSNAARVAEGGLEFVYPLETKHKHIALMQLRKAGYQIVHLTRQRQAPHLSRIVLSKKIVFVLSEVISNEVEYPEDSIVQLSFSNSLNSGLNVAVNAGILLAQWYQNHML